MSDNNIDNIFKNAATQYSPPAPKTSWSKLDGALKSQRKALFIKNITIAASVFIVVASSIIIALNVDDNNDAKSLSNIDNIAQFEAKTKDENPKNNIQITDNLDINSDSKNDKLSTPNTLLNSESNTDANMIAKVEDVTNESVAATGITINKLDTLSLANVDMTTNIEDVNSVGSGSDMEKNNSDEFIAISKIKSSESNNKEVINNDINSNNNLNLIADSKTTNDGINSVILDSNISEDASDKSNIIASVNTDHNNTKELIKDNNTIELDSETTDSKGTTAITNENINNEIASAEIKSDDKQQDSTVNKNIIADNKEKSEKNTILKSIMENKGLKFFIANSYGVSITGGVGKDIEIKNDNLAFTLNTKTAMGFLGGVDFGIEYGNFVFSAGVRRYDLKFNGDFKMKETNPYAIDPNNFGYTQFGIIQLDNVSSNVRLANPQSAIYVQDFDKYSVKFRNIEVPLSIGYGFRSNSWSVNTHLGVSPTFIISNEIKLEKDDKFMFAKIKDSEEFMLGFNGGAGLNYRISKYWMIGINADFVYYANSLSKDAKFDYCPYSILISPRLEFRF